MALKIVKMKHKENRNGTEIFDVTILETSLFGWIKITRTIELFTMTGVFWFFVSTGEDVARESRDLSEKLQNIYRKNEMLNAGKWNTEGTAG